MYVSSGSVSLTSCSILDNTADDVHLLLQNLSLTRHFLEVSSIALVDFKPPWMNFELRFACARVPMLGCFTFFDAGGECLSIAPLSNFSSEHSLPSAQGGGMYINDGHVELISCNINHNTAEYVRGFLPKVERPCQKSKLLVQRPVELFSCGPVESMLVLTILCAFACLWFAARHRFCLQYTVSAHLLLNP